MTAAFIWLTAFPVGATDNDIVRIGIREGQGSVSVVGPFGVGVYRNGSLWKKYAAGKNVTVTYSDKGLTVDGAALGQRVLLRSLDAKGALKISNGYSYRGDLEVIKSPQRWGIMDYKGNIICPAQFTHTNYFRNGKTTLQKADGQNYTVYEDGRIEKEKTMY